jgi:uncharacterized protein YodC (DUF2158 family)
LASDPPRTPSLDELLAEIRGGFAPRKDYDTALPERFRKPRAPKPPPEPTVEERSGLDEALARFRGQFYDASQPDVFGTTYQPPPVEPEPPPDPSLIQKKTEDEIAVGAKRIEEQGGDVEDYVNKMHQLRYGKRIASLLKAGRDHAVKLAREGTDPEEAAFAGVDLAQKHITNLETQIANGEQSREADERGGGYEGLIQSLTTGKGLAGHGLATVLPMGLGFLAKLKFGGPAGMIVAGGATIAGIAAQQKFIEGRENVDWKEATVEGLTNMLELPVLGELIQGPVGRIANPLVRTAVGTAATAGVEAIEEPTQAIASSLAQGRGMPSGYSLGLEAAGGGIIGGALGGGLSVIVEGQRQQISDDTAGATEIEAAPPQRKVGRSAQGAADDQLAEIERALAGARFGGDLNAIQSLEAARQAILDARAKGSEAPVPPDPPAPGEAGPTAPAPAPPPTPPAAPPPGPAAPGAPTPGVGGPPPGPVSGTSVRPQVPAETAAGAAGETPATEEARQRAAGAAPQVRSLTEQGKAAAEGGPVPPTPPVVRGPTSGTARGVTTTPTLPSPTPTAAPAGRAASPAAPGPSAAAPAPPAAISPPQAPPIIPARRLKIGRGAHGQVSVVFPDQIHADLFSAIGRQRRQARGEGGRAPDWPQLAHWHGVPPDLIGGVAERYRAAIMDAVRNLPEGETFTAPSLAEVLAPPPAVAPPPPAAAPAAPPAAATTGSRIILSKRDGVWVASHEGPIADEVEALFGARDIPTPYPDTVNAETILAEIQGRNPDVEVVLEGQVPVGVTPAEAKAYAEKHPKPKHEAEFKVGDEVLLKSGARGVVVSTSYKGREGVYEVETKDYRGRKRKEVAPAGLRKAPPETPSASQEGDVTTRELAQHYMERALENLEAEKALGPNATEDDISRARLETFDSLRLAEAMGATKAEVQAIWKTVRAARGESEPTAKPPKKETASQRKTREVLEKGAKGYVQPGIDFEGFATGDRVRVGNRNATINRLWAVTGEEAGSVKKLWDYKGTPVKVAELSWEAKGGTQNVALARVQKIGPGGAVAAETKEQRKARQTEERAARRKARTESLNELEKKIVTSEPGSVVNDVWPQAQSLDFAKEWYDNGKMGANVALYRVLVNARQLGVEIHEEWYRIFPDLKDVAVEGKRKRVPVEPREAVKAPAVAGALVFSSGMSRTGDLLAGLNWEHPIGVDINELSDKGMDQIANAISQGYEPKIFVDSGAFSAFKRGETQDLKALVQRYAKLIDKIIEANVNEEATGELILTMPDVIGQQAQTFSAFKEGAAEMARLPPIFRVLFPLQTGQLSIDQFLGELLSTESQELQGLFNGRAIWGIPSNAKAAPVEEIAELGSTLRDFKALGERISTDVHFLGAGSEKTLGPLVKALEGDRAGELRITGDANKLRAQIRAAGERAGAVEGVVGAEPGAPPEPIAPATPAAFQAGEPFEVKQVYLPKSATRPRPIRAVHLVDVNGNVLQSQNVENAEEGRAQEARWIREFNLAALEPVEPAEPAVPEDPLAGFGPNFRKAVEAAIARAPEGIRAQLAQQAGQQQERRRIAHRAESDWEYFGRQFDQIGQRIKNRAAKRRAAKDNLDNARALYEAGWETMRGTLKDAPESAAIQKRLQQLVEGKGVPGVLAPVERPPITTRAYAGIKGFVEHHPNAPTLAEAVTKVQEYAKAYPRTAEDVLPELQRLAGEVESMGADALRQVIDVPGLGPGKVRAALAKASGPDFDAIVAYRREAEAQERAAQELYAEVDEEPYVHPGLTSIADALEEDEAAGLNAGPDADPPLLKTFMWGVEDPATGKQVEQDAAIKALRAGTGRLFARIRTAHQDAMAAVEHEIPFDVPEGGAADDEFVEAKRDEYVFVSAERDPYEGRYGPPPHKMTPEQLEAQRKWIAKRFGGPGAEPIPARSPAADVRRNEGEAPAPTAGLTPGGARAPVGEGAAGGGGRGGRGLGVPRGVPGAAGQPREAAPASRAGIFYIVNPREAQTLARPPKYDLIPPRLMPHLSDEQKLGVAKAIEALDAGSGFLFQDGTGVGKTREILATAARYADQGFKVLIVSKSSAIEATKGRDGKWRASGSYADDAEAMGVPLEFTKERGRGLKPGSITLGTYHRLRDYVVDKNTVLVFDESHQLKNMGDSEVASEGADLMRRARVTLFASATPGDKAYHLGYLASIGLFEGKDPEQALRDLGLQAKPKKRVSKKLYQAALKAEMAKLGPNPSEYAKEQAKARSLEAATEEYQVWHMTSPTKHRRALEALFDRLTERGTVIKREVDLSPVAVQTIVVPIGEEGHAAMKLIEEGKFDRKNALMHMRRQQEPYKLDRVKELILQELGLGRQVVVFAERVNESEVVERTKDPRTGFVTEKVLMQSEGTLKQLAEWVAGEQISLAEIHGESPESSKNAQERFQSGNAKVVIATYGKGGTGINLDDRSGAAPRTMILMTAPFGATDIVQAIGRVHRFTTKSSSKILLLYSDHEIDRWNAAVIGGKLKQHHAQVSGDIAALDLGNTSADEAELSAGSGHYMDVAALLAAHGPAGAPKAIYSPRHYGKLIRQLKQLGVKINLKGGDFEIPTHEGFTIIGSIEKTPNATAYASLKWEHDDEAGDLRVAEAVKPRPVSRERTATVEARLTELLDIRRQARRAVVSAKQYDFFQRVVTQLGGSWGVTELPGSFQIQTADGDFFVGELAPIKEGARMVFGRPASGDEGAFYWRRLSAPPVEAEAEEEQLEAPRADYEPGIDAAMARDAEEDVEADDPGFAQVGQVTGVVGQTTASVGIPTYERPELSWGRPIRIGNGTLLRRGAPVPGTPGASIAATTIREGFSAVGYINWTGIVVRSVADAGAVFHTARNPSLEHAVLFFVDTYGVIRGSMQATSNLPSRASWGEGESFYREIEAKLQAFADQGIEIKGVIDLHNHPSSRTDSSGSDRQHFQGLRDRLGVKYLGSAIIDHETISVHPPTGKEYKVVKKKGGFADPDPFLAEGIDSALFYHRDSPFKLRSVDDIRSWAESMLDQGLWQNGSSDISVAFLDGQLRTRVVTIVPQSIFLNERAWRELTETMARVSGGDFIVAATDGGFARAPAVAQAADHYVKKGLLQDMVDLQSDDSPRGRLRGQGHPLPRSYNWKDGPSLASQSLRLEQSLDSMEPPLSAYPAWNKDAPDWWGRRVAYARARTLERGRAATASVGIDPQTFWDAFVLGVDAVRRGIRSFGAWLAALGRDIPNFGSWGRSVWRYMVSVGAPVVVETGGRARPFERALAAVPGAPSAERNLQPIRTIPRVTPNDLAASVEALLSPTPADRGAGKPLGIGVPEDLAVNINNVTDQADIRETMARIVRALEKRFDLARQKYTSAELHQLALALGYDEADYIRMLKAKGALTAPEIIAGRVLRQQAGVDFSNRWAAWRDATERTKEQGLSPEEKRKRSLDALEAEREKLAALQKLVGMMYGTAAAGAEAGRALYAHKLLISTLTPEEQYLQKVLRAGRADAKQVAELADALAKGDNAAVARLIRKIHRPGLVKMLVEYFINSLLSGPPTFVANVTGNIVHEGMRTGERAFAARLEQLGVRQGIERLLTGQAKPEDRVVGEAMAALRAQARHKFGILAALDMARQAITREDLRFLQAVKGESYVPAIPGLFGRVVRTPGRVMEALDIGAKMNAMAAEKAALLWRRAYTEMRGRVAPHSPEFNERLAELHDLMNEWIALEEQRLADPAQFQADHGAEGYTFLYRNRDLAQIYRAMKQAADVSTFRDETTRFTNFVKQVRGAYPWLSFVVPFVHTTERILIQGFRRTPVGLLKSLYNIQQGKLEGGEASDRLAQGLLGTMTTAAIYMFAADGLITGGGPDDPKERENWLKTGKLPYAIRIGDQWVSYARIEPFATIFGFAADLAEAKDEKTAGDAFGKLHYAMLNNITNKTYLEGIVSAAEAVGNPDRYMARFWKRSAGALVPNLLATAARAIDPTIRETDDLSQVLISRIPILSEKLPARITGTGEPRRRGETALSRFVSPVRYSEEAGPEANLERLFLETGYSPSQPPRDITLPGTLGRKVELTREEREVYGAYARRATEFARSLAKNGDWTRLDVYAKEEVLKRIYRFAHDRGRRAMLASVAARLRQGKAEVVKR